MTQANATIVIVIGLLLLWLAVTGRLGNVGDAWAVLNGEADSGALSPRETAVRTPITDRGVYIPPILNFGGNSGGGGR